jgi:hypothetical protein
MVGKPFAAVVVAELGEKIVDAFHDGRFMAG